MDNAHAAPSSTPRTTGDWLSPGRFALLLGLLVLASFPKVLLGFETFVVRDYGFFVYPLAHFQKEAFWNGELPLWNPYNNCGVPFLAQWNTMPLYPPALLYLLLPLEWALSAFSLAHLWLGGVGMYFLARHWTGSRYGAAVAGVMFAFNGLSLNMLMWPSHIATLSWMPWVVLWGQRGWTEGGRTLALAAVLGALQMLAGGPETILLTWLLLSCLWVGHLWRNRRDGFPQAIHWRFPLIVLLVAGLAAAQLLPFLDLAAHSQREGGYADSRWALPAWGWANFFVPLVFGRVWKMGVFFQHDQAWTSSYYLGIGGLVLALTAILVVRDRRVTLLAVWSGVLLLLAFGDQSLITRWLRHAVPALTAVTYPVKFVTGIVMAAPLLAAFAAARWADRADVQWRRGALLIGGLAGAAIFGIILWSQAAPLPQDDTALGIRSGWERGVFLLAILLLLVAGQGVLRGAAWRLAPALVLLLLWLDVLTHAPNQNPSVPAWVYDPALARTKLELSPTPELGKSRVMVSPMAEKMFTDFSSSNIRDNFVVKRLGYFANCNLFDHTPKVNGFFSIYPRASGDLASVLYATNNLFYPPLMDFMGVSHVTDPDSFAAWRPRRAWLPFATIGQQPVILEDTAALLTICHTNFRPQNIVVLPGSEAGALLSTNGANGRVTSLRIHREEVQVEVEADAATLVVLAQTYYHRWKAYVDGKPAPLLRANYAFQAVPVPAGPHTVRVVYEDYAFRAGAGLSALTALAVGFLGFRRRAAAP